MSWHKLTLKVIDVLALLGHRCLGTHHVIFKDMITSLTYPTGMGVTLKTAGLFDPRNNSAIRGQIV